MRVWFTGVKLDTKYGESYEYVPGDASGLLVMLTDTKGSLMVSIEYGLSKLFNLVSNMKPGIGCADLSDDCVLDKLDPSEPLELINFRLEESHCIYNAYPKHDYQFKGKRIDDIIDGFNAKAIGLGLNVKIDPEKFGVAAYRNGWNVCSGNLEARVCGSPYINTLGNNLFIGSDITKFKCDSGLLKIGSNCFESSKLTEITFNESLMYIGAWAFRGCSDLTKLILPKSLRVLGQSSISFCESLVYLELNDGLQFMADNAVYFCDNLRNVKINMVDPRMISEYAFMGCDLRKVSIPKRLADNTQIKKIIEQIERSASDPVKIALF